MCGGLWEAVWGQFCRQLESGVSEWAAQVLLSQWSDTADSQSHSGQCPALSLHSGPRYQTNTKHAASWHHGQIGKLRTDRNNVLVLLHITTQRWGLMKDGCKINCFLPDIVTNIDPEPETWKLRAQWLINIQSSEHHCCENIFHVRKSSWLYHCLRLRRRPGGWQTSPLAQRWEGKEE